MTNADVVRAAVSSVIDPELRRSLGELNMVRAIQVAEGRVDVVIALTIVGCPAAARIAADVRTQAQQAAPDAEVQVTLEVMTAEERTALIESLRGGSAARTNPFTREALTRVIAVSSGKGGVGKSTVTANLAVAFAQRGLTVGLIDADVHGFSIPGILGLEDAKPTRVGDLILPPIAHDVRVMSIGMFVDDPATPVAWRGPMLHRTISQFLTDVYFGDLDILLLDLPPGTGDIAISLGQLLPHAEVLVVTTPQPAAASVAERSGRVARQTGQTVRGVIENMSGFALPDGGIADIFGSGGGAAVAERLEVPLLAQIPLSIDVRAGGDAGMPVVLSRPDDPAARAIVALAEALSVRAHPLAGRGLPLSPKG